jgi:molecular chaperone GrpE (heat shock protein)
VAPKAVAMEELDQPHDVSRENHISEKNYVKGLEDQIK